MNFQKFRTTHYRPLINYCWGNDEFLWRISEYTDLEHATDVQTGILDASGPDFKLFEVFTDDGIFVGYYGRELAPVPWLTTIFLMPEFRKDYNSEFWNYITSEFKSDFFCGLIKCNFRATKFYKRMGGLVLLETDIQGRPSTIFHFKRT